LVKEQTKPTILAKKGTGNKGQFQIFGSGLTEAKSFQDLHQKSNILLDIHQYFGHFSLLILAKANQRGQK
jgi:hypothetical protein